MAKQQQTQNTMVETLDTVSRPPVKVLVLVIASEGIASYPEHQRLWRAQSHPHITTYFLRRFPGITQLLIEGDTVYVPGEETFGGIIHKTMAALDHFVDAGFDYVYRSNLSTLHHYGRFYEHITSLPRQGVYSGAVMSYEGRINYASGTGILLSADVWRTLLTRRERCLSCAVIDDVDIGYTLYDVPIRDMPRTDITTSTYTCYPYDSMRYRVKFEDGAARAGEVRVLQDIVAHWDRKEPTTTFVTALLLPDGEPIHRSKKEYLENLLQLCAVGVPLHIYLDASIEWSYDFPNVTIVRTTHTPRRDCSILPDYVNKQKDTLDYMSIMLEKARYMKEVAATVSTDYVAWIDCGTPRFFYYKIDLRNQLHAICGRRFRTDKVISPGCWASDTAPQELLWKQIYWVFCGTFLLCHRDLAEDFHRRQEALVVEHAPRITWEVNYWVMMQDMFARYPADHNHTLLLGLFTDQMKEGTPFAASSFPPEAFLQPGV